MAPKPLASTHPVTVYVIWEITIQSITVNMKEILFQCNKCIVSKIFMYELFEFFQEIGLRGE